jgi:hypothetical protein
MNVLRIILIICLSLSVPTTALASIMSQAQCEHGHDNTRILSTDQMQSSESMQHSDHSQHRMEHTSSTPDKPGQCSHCSSGHCAGGTATAIITLSPNVISEKSEHRRIVTPDNNTAAAHSNSLFRPPA